MTWFVTEPAGGAKKTLEILQDDEATWKRGVIEGYGYGGSVRVRFDDGVPDGLQWVDLTKEQYRWVV